MLELPIQPLLAAAGEIFGLLVTLVILAVGALNQYLSKNAEKRQREGARPRPPGQPGSGQGRPRPRTPEDAVEEFLRRAHSQDDVVPVEVVEVEEVSEPGGIAAHVNQYFSDGSPERDLVSVDDADEQMTEHLHDAFDHDVGSFGGGRGESARQEQRASMADALLGMLRSPQGITSAIVVHEILERPKFDD